MTRKKLVKDILSLDSIIANVHLNKADPISQEAVLEVRNFLKHIKTKDEEIVIKILDTYYLECVTLTDLLLEVGEEQLFDKEFTKANLIKSLYK